MMELEGIAVVQALSSDQCELAICRVESLDVAAFEWITLCRDRLVAVLPEHHPLAQKSAIPLDALKDEAF